MKHIRRLPPPCMPPTPHPSHLLNPHSPPCVHLYGYPVMAGDQHPLYLTSSIVGGGSYGNFTGETIYAGGLDSHGGVGRG